MPIAVHQEDNVGSVFVFEVLDENGAIVNLATATLLEAIFRPAPGVVSFTRTGVLTTDGTDGKFEYVTIVGDLVPAGKLWERQGRVTVPSLGTFKTFVREFVVKPNL